MKESAMKEHTYIVDYYNKSTGKWGIVKPLATNRKAAMKRANSLLGKGCKVVGAHRKPERIA